MKYEHTYQYLPHLFQTLPSARDSFTLSRTHERHKRPDWETVKMQLMEDVLMAKVRLQWCTAPFH